MGKVSANSQLATEYRCQTALIYGTLLPIEPDPSKKVGWGKIFIAEKRETSYYRFCGYGNYENTYLFVR